MEIILVKTTTCSKCRQLQPTFEGFCIANKVLGRQICYDTAPECDKKLVEELNITSVPSLIFIKNDFKRVYSDVSGLDGITYAFNDFNASEGV